MTLFRIKKNDGSLDLPILEKAIDTLVRISDQAKLQRETSNTQDSDAGKYGGLVPPQNIELTSYRETAGVTLSPNATVKASWAPVSGASYYDVELDTNESEGHGAYNKESRSNTCFWQNMTLGITVKLRVRSCNSAYKSEWSEVVERHVINGDYTSVGALVISSNRLFRWIHCSVAKVNRRLYPQHRGFEWQWSTTTGFIPNEQEHKNNWEWTTGSVTHYGYKKLSFSNHCVFRVQSLTAPIFARVRAFDKDGNKTAWSIEYEVGNDLPASITSFEAGLLPLKIGWFKRVQWRLNLEWVWAVPDGGDTDMNGSFNIQYRRNLGTLGFPIYGPKVRHFADLDPDDKSAEHNIPLVFPPRNLTLASNGYTPTNLTNILVRIRARENGAAGSWFPTSTAPVDRTDVVTIGSELWLRVRFVEPDDADDIIAPTGGSFTAHDDGAFGRFIKVCCCDGDWDAPNTFSHFSIHARIVAYENRGYNWLPTEQDKIYGGVTLEHGISGITCRVPRKLLYIPGDTTSKKVITTNMLANTSGGGDCLQIFIVPHCWSGATKILPTPYYTLHSVGIVASTSDTQSIEVPTSITVTSPNTWAIRRWLHCVCSPVDTPAVRYYQWRFKNAGNDTYETRVSLSPETHIFLPRSITYTDVEISVRVVGHNGATSDYTTHTHIVADSARTVAEPSSTPDNVSGHYFSKMTIFKRLIMVKCDPVTGDDVGFPGYYLWTFCNSNGTSRLDSYAHASLTNSTIIMLPHMYSVDTYCYICVKYISAPHGLTSAASTETRSVAFTAMADTDEGTRTVPGAPTFLTCHRLGTGLFTKRWIAAHVQHADGDYVPKLYHWAIFDYSNQSAIIHATTATPFLFRYVTIAESNPYNTLDYVACYVEAWNGEYDAANCTAYSSITDPTDA